MVVICLPSAALTGITHERTALPSICTVHAPHIAMPQPYLVPVRPTCSRIAHSRGVLGSTLTSLAFPLIVRRAMAPLLRECSAKNIRYQALEGKLSRVGRLAPGRARDCGRDPSIHDGRTGDVACCWSCPRQDAPYECFTPPTSISTATATETPISKWY